MFLNVEQLKLEHSVHIQIQMFNFMFLLFKLTVIAALGFIICCIWLNMSGSEVFLFKDMKRTYIAARNGMGAVSQNSWKN